MYISCHICCRSSVLSNWERFHKGIHQYGLYTGEDPAVDGILQDMVQEQIVDIGNGNKSDALFANCVCSKCTTNPLVMLCSQKCTINPLVAMFQLTSYSHFNEL